MPHATSRPPEIDSQTVSLPSRTPTSVVHPDSSPKKLGSIRFNKKVKKELALEMAHTLCHDEWISCLKFSQDGEYLAVGCEDGKAYIYDVQTGTLNCTLKNLFAEQDYLGAICFSCDGKYLVTGSLDKNIYIWEIKTKYVRNAFKGHTRWILSIGFSPNGRQVVSASGDNTARIWNMRDGVATILGKGNPTDDELSCSPAIFSPDGRYVASSHSNGVVRITLLRRVKAHINWVDEIAFMPDGKGLVTGSRDTTLKYWDLSSCARPRDSLTGVEEQARPKRQFSGHMGHVYSVAISPDGRWVASGSDDHSVRIWDSRSGNMQCILKDDDSVWTLDLSPAGGYLAFGGTSGTVNIWRYSSIISRLHSKAAK